uniref:NADH-ubiquinone oxidoreductase chain 4 n=1 Tax=Neolepetopsis sp. TaxID=3071115 RepID=A0AA96HSA4_9GAST|nr:NADH dehydrogenase subunit 4 [Neolepetopsis sp.]
MKVNSDFMISTPISTSLITLTWWISFLMMLASQKSIFINNKSKENFSMLIVTLNMVLIMTFSSSNMFWFYVFFELSLIPTLLLILGWGYQPERLQAGMHMMMYTITASLPFMVILLNTNLTMNKLTLMLKQSIYSPSWTLNLIMMMSLLAFLVKLPMYSMHLWLPKAHVEAPIAGSMILAGILLKLGGFGLIQTLDFYKMNSFSLSLPLSSLALWGGFITSAICTRQTDLKALIAYSSVAHMSFVAAGILSMTTWGWSASFMIMISHGLCSSAMFFLANTTYEMTHSRSMLIPKGLLKMLPSYSMWWFLFCTANIPAPPSITLMGEIIAIPAIINLSPMFILTIIMMALFSTTYNLLMYVSCHHGPNSKSLNPSIVPHKINQMIISFHFAPLIMLFLSLPKIMF